MFYSYSNLLFQIQQTPERFLDEKSLYKLIPFVDGYSRSHELIMDIPFDAFGAWVSDRYHLPRELGFEKAIRANTKTEAEAFDAFFDLLSRFQSNDRIHQTENKPTKTRVTEETIIEFLLRYEKRIAMMIGENSFCRLVCFVNGFQWDPQTNTTAQYDQYLGFTAFVKTKLSVAQTCRYDRGILAFASSDRDALLLFFQLLHEFLSMDERRETLQ